ncbi:MAG: carboxypeptidase regulatory-like domain-containing protein [Polyangiales bacterium]
MLAGIVLTILFGLLPGSPLVSFMWEETNQEPEPLPDSDTERPGSARVRVLDEAGAPLVGATVRALYVENGVVYLAARVLSGTDGYASLERLPIGVHWILADAPGRARASSQRFVGPEPVSIELRLSKERALQVEVRDELGKAVANAEIEVRGADPLPRGARTGKDGIARPTALGAGPLKISAHANGFETATGSATATDTKVKLVVRKLGALVVSVVDASGAIVEGASVTIAGGLLAVPRTTTTDATGKSRIAGLSAGSYDLRATKGSLVSPIDIGVTLPRGVEGNVKLVLAAGRFVRVVVVDDGSRPIPKADVMLAEGGLSPFPFSGVTDATGAVVLGPIAPGPAAVAARAEGFVPRGPIAATDVTTIVLRKAATLIGDVRDTRGVAIDGASIEVVGTDLDGLPIDAKPAALGFSAALLARMQGGAGRALLPIGELGVVPGPVPPIPHGPIAKAAPGVDPWVTRADGTFRATPVPPGRLRAIVRHPAYVEAISAPVLVEAGGEGSVSVVLSAGGRLSGRVRDEKGFTVAGAFIEVAARAGSTARGVRTASDGTFVLVALPGEVTVTLSPPDRPNEIALRVDVTIPAGGTKELELTLPAPRGSTKVHVIDDRRYPLKGAQVTIASLDPMSPVKTTGFTDDRGDAEIPRVAGLRVQLEVQAFGFALHREIKDPLGTTLEIELAVGIAVKGVVYAPGGRVARAGATVSLFGEGGVRRTLSDAQGRFAFVDVPKGEATIEARASGAATIKRALTVGPTGSRAEVDVGRLELGAAGIVEGTVVDEKGHPVPGARVAKDRAPTWVPASGLLPGVAITDASGSFKLSDVAVGEIELEAYAADVGRGRVEKIRVDEGRTTPSVRIVVQKTGATDADLAPGGVAVTLADLDGHVVLAAVAPGSEAERAGLLESDEIISVDGVAPTSISAARARLSGPLGADVILVIRRKGSDKSVRVPREPIKR